MTQLKSIVIFHKWYYIGQQVIEKNGNKVTAFSGKRDWLSGTKVINFLAIKFERLTGIVLPRTVGKVYQMPILHNESVMKQHSDFYQQLKILKDMDYL